MSTNLETLQGINPIRIASVIPSRSTHRRFLVVTCETHGYLASLDAPSWDEFAWTDALEVAYGHAAVWHARRDAA